MEREFKGVWIPKEIWLSKELKALEKLFFIEIDSLDCKQGCFASNAHFSELFDISKQRASQIIATLEEKNYIKTTYIREGKQVKKRIIRVSRKFDTPIKFIKGGYQINAKGTNTNEYRESIKRKQFVKPTLEEIAEHMQDKFEAENFFYFYESKNWMVGKNKMQVWKSAASGWMNRKKKNEKNKQHNKSTSNEKLRQANQEGYEYLQELQKSNRAGVRETLDASTNPLPATELY